MRQVGLGCLGKHTAYHKARKDSFGSGEKGEAGQGKEETEEEGL